VRKVRLETKPAEIVRVIAASDNVLSISANDQGDAYFTTYNQGYLSFVENTKGQYFAAYANGLVRIKNANSAYGGYMDFDFHDSDNVNDRYTMFAVTSPSDPRSIVRMYQNGYFRLGYFEDSGYPQAVLDIGNAAHTTESEREPGLLLLRPKNNRTGNVENVFMWTKTDGSIRVHTSNPGNDEDAGKSITTKNEGEKIYLDGEGGDCYVWYNTTTSEVEIYSDGNKVFPT